MENRPRVLFVGAFPPKGSAVYGGIVSSCRALLGSTFADRVELVLHDTTVSSLPPPPPARRALQALPRTLGFVRLFIKYRPDAILIFASSGMGFYEKLVYCSIGKRLGVNSVMSIRDGYIRAQLLSPGRPWHRRLMRRLLEAPRFLLAQSEGGRRFLVEEVGIPAERCRVLENWTAGEEVLQIGSTREASAASAHVRVLFAGWMDRTKGIFELIDAFDGVLQRPDRPSLHLTLAGAGVALEEARQHVGRLGLEDHVTFTGYVEGDKLRKLYAEADIFALPSYAEGLPNSMVEAMAAGLPVIVTPVGSVPDVIGDGVEGVIVPVLDRTALEDALYRLATQPALRAEMGRRGYVAARERFSTERAAERLAELLVEATRLRTAA